MIQFEKRTAKEYHMIDMDSSSTLKDFSIDRKKYYRKYVLGEKVEDDDNESSLMGRMVETITLEPDEFDNRFYMSICLKPPTNGTNMYKFCHALYKHAMESLNEDKVVTRPFEELAYLAHKDSGYKYDLARVLKEFVESGAKTYYQEMIESRPKGLQVVSTEMRDNAQRVADALLTDQGIVGTILNLRSSKRYTVLDQLQIEGFYIDGLKMKCMIDKLVIDLQEKTIQIYDLKCVWNVEDFYTGYYLKRRAYLQGLIYASALRSEQCKLELGGLDICEFEILPPVFIVCDSANYYNPLLYKMTEHDIVDAYEGFTYNNYYYPGLKELIPDLQWAKENDIWMISKKNYDRGSILHIQDCKNKL